MYVYVYYLFRSFCKLKKFPDLIRKCVVSVDCIVSPWSEWLIQKEGCIASDGNIHPETRVRQRKLLQLPVGIKAKPCPPLFDEIVLRIGLPPCDK